MQVAYLSYPVDMYIYIVCYGLDSMILLTDIYIYIT